MENTNDNKIIQDRHLRPKIWITVLVVFGLLVVYLALAGANSWWPFDQNQGISSTGSENNSSLSDNNSTSPQTLSSPGEGEFEGWQTYRNEEFGFEFRYPGDFNKVEAKEKQGPYDLHNFFLTLRSDIEIDERLVLLFYNNYLNNKGSLKEYLDVNKQRGPGDIVATSVEYNRYSDSIGLNVFIAEKYNMVHFLIARNNDVISIASPSNNKIAIQKILSTFKFIEPTVDPSDWKTHHGEQFGFEFKYPSDWIVTKPLRGDFEIKTPNFDPVTGSALGTVKVKALSVPDNMDIQSWLDFSVAYYSRGDIENINKRLVVPMSYEDGVITIAGVEGFDQYISDQGRSSRYVYLQNNLREYDQIMAIILTSPLQFTKTTVENDKVENLLETFNQILSTFRFID